MHTHTYLGTVQSQPADTWAALATATTPNATSNTTAQRILCNNYNNHTDQKLDL